MKRFLALLAPLVVLVFVGPAAGITNGQFDGNAHPNVGAFLWDGNHDGVKTVLCTVSLISPRVVLTASHCTEYADRFHSEVWVTFDPTAVDDNPTGVIHGHTVTNPLYDAKQLYAHDTSVIVLDKAVKTEPVKLAAVGLLDQMKADRSIYSAVFTNVGYGTHEQVVVKASGPGYLLTGDREWSISKFDALDPVFIHLSQNLAQGWGGTGYGDSGGPTFLETANGPVQISTVSTGDVSLYATSVNTRVDTQDARDFLTPFLALR
jgi:secreted trypsin-like serine protease